MWQRLSSVDKLKSGTVIFSSALLIGDTKYVDTFRSAIAIETDIPTFTNTPKKYEKFKVVDDLPHYALINENVKMDFIQQNPVIHVCNIQLVTVSNAAVIHIGNGDYARLQSDGDEFKLYELFELI